MKHSNFGHKLVFGLLGGTYTVVGGVFLTLAITKTGGVQEIFSHPEEDIVVFATLGTVFLLLGIAFLIVTLLLARADKRRARMREELLTWGSRVKGEVVDVRVDYTVRVNRRSPGDCEGALHIAQRRNHTEKPSPVGCTPGCRKCGGGYL